MRRSLRGNVKEALKGEWGEGADEEDPERRGEEQYERKADKARRVRAARDPGAPSRDEYEQHLLNHKPCKACCPWCVTGRGRSDQHRRKRRAEHEIHIVEMKCCQVGELSTPMLYLGCSVTGIIRAHAMEWKDITGKVVQTAMKGWQGAHADHSEERNRTGDEGAVEQGQGHEVAPTIVEESTEYEPQANGLAERGAQTIKGISVTAKSAFEHRLGCHVPDDPVILTW